MSDNISNHSTAPARELEVGDVAQGSGAAANPTGPDDAQRDGATDPSSVSRPGDSVPPDPATSAPAPTPRDADPEAAPLPYDRHSVHGQQVRGAAMFHCTDQPSVAWGEVVALLQADADSVAPNVVRFHLPDLSAKDRKKVWDQLNKLFIRAFPGKAPAAIRLPDERAAL